MRLHVLRPAASLHHRHHERPRLLHLVRHPLQPGRGHRGHGQQQHHPPRGQGHQGGGHGRAPHGSRKARGRHPRSGKNPLAAAPPAWLRQRVAPPAGPPFPHPPGGTQLPKRRCRAASHRSGCSDRPANAHGERFSLARRTRAARSLRAPPDSFQLPTFFLKTEHSTNRIKSIVRTRALSEPPSGPGARGRRHRRVPGSREPRPLILPGAGGPLGRKGLTSRSQCVVFGGTLSQAERGAPGDPRKARLVSKTFSTGERGPQVPKRNKRSTRFRTQVFLPSLLQGAPGAAAQAGEGAGGPTHPAPKQQRSPLTPHVAQAAPSHSGPSSPLPPVPPRSAPVFHAPHLPFPELPGVGSLLQRCQHCPHRVEWLKHPARGLYPHPAPGALSWGALVSPLEPRGRLIHRSAMTRPA